MAKLSNLNQPGILEGARQLAVKYALDELGLPAPFGQIAALFIRESKRSAAKRLANSIGSGAVKLSEVQYYATAAKASKRDKAIARRALKLAKK